MSEPASADDYFEQITIATLPDPWAMVFLPDGNMLVTERPAAGASVLNPIDEGHIRLVTQAGEVSVPLTGLPENVGVLDIVLSPDFAENHVIYFSYLERDPSAPRVGRNADDERVDPAGVVVARAVLDLSDPAAPALTSTSIIWEQSPKIVSNPGSGEPGGRLAFSPDGEYLYIASGDRQEFGPVQQMDDTLGKVIRLYPDGTVPMDNPFEDVSGALPEIWTLGHRNPYGLTFDANGVLWQHEMGPKGGDELNIIQPGLNFGWPNVSYGNNYDSSPIPDPTPGDGYEPSEFWWTQVIAPSGMISYSGTAFPDWTSDLIISGLQSKGLVIVDTSGTTPEEVLRIDLGQRTRDVRQGPDGSIWVLFDQPDGRLVQLKPLDPSALNATPVPTTVIQSPLPEGELALTALTTGNVVGLRQETLGGASSLKAQLYGSGGQALGTEITLNSVAAGDQGEASLTALANGGFAVAWGSRTSGVFNVYLQIFDADGDAIAPASLLDTGSASFRSPPSISALSDGRLAVSWLVTDALGTAGVRVQLLTATGDKIGTEITASDHPESGKIDQHIVALSGGGFAVSWTDGGIETDAYGNANTAVRAQIFDASGQKVGSAFTINHSAPGNQNQSALTPTEDGGLIAVWRDDGYGFYSSVTGTQGIWAQRISATGQKIGDPIHVSESGDYGFAPSVTALPGIGFAIAWQEGASSIDGDRTILARVLDFDGQPLGSAFTLAANADRSLPSVAATADGHLLFSWSSDVDQTVAFNVVAASIGDTELAGTAGKDLILGSNADETITSGAGADVLSGGGGNDIFLGTINDLNGDTITDFSIGDTIRLSDLSRGLPISLDGDILRFNGNSLKLENLPAGMKLNLTDAPGGGIDIRLAPLQVRNDFDGDGRSDILWRHDSGQLSNWLGQANGGFVQNDNAALRQVATDWSVAGTGDFNGDGKVDLLWRNSDGRMSDWLATGSGAFTPNDEVALVQVSRDWQIAGTDDFNGDGRSDILWRSVDGSLSTWLGRADGGFVNNDSNAFTSAGTDWHVVGTGDFNGDGRADILWRNNDGRLSNWLGTAAGSFTLNDTNALTQVPTPWRVVGTGDFNGDGFDDLLWRHADGSLSDWLGNAHGGFTTNDAAAFTKVDPSWKVAEVADYNGDGRDDILWRHDSGQFSDWLGTAAGGFVMNDAHAFNAAPTAWHIQSDTFFVV